MCSGLPSILLDAWMGQRYSQADNLVVKLYWHPVFFDIQAGQVQQTARPEAGRHLHRSAGEEEIQG